MDTRQKNQTALKTLASNVARLSHLLTRERADLASAYLKEEGLREAYRAYFLPPNIEKVKILLGAAGMQRECFLGKEKLRVLDLGCGPGTAAPGVIEFFAAKERRPVLEFVALDQVAQNLKIAEELFISCRSAYDHAATLRTVRMRIEDAVHFAEKPFDLIILSNALNELFLHEEGRIRMRIALIQAVMARLLSQDGLFLVIEPALRETSRELLQVRDGLVSRGTTLIAPCIFRGNCPALANPRDWCHEDVPWEPPALIRELDNLTGLRKDSLKFSYLVLGHHGGAAGTLSDKNLFRVVSEPLVSKGKIEFYLCGKNGRHLSVRFDKDGTLLNRIFKDLRRGDRADFENLIVEGRRLKVGKETAVTRTS